METKGELELLMNMVIKYELLPYIYLVDILYFMPL